MKELFLIVIKVKHLLQDLTTYWTTSPIHLSIENYQEIHTNKFGINVQCVVMEDLVGYLNWLKGKYTSVSHTKLVGKLPIINMSMQVY